MFKTILLVLILAFIGAGIYSYVSPAGSKRLWAPVTNFVKSVENSSVNKTSTKTQSENQKEIDKLGFGQKK